MRNAIIGVVLFVLGVGTASAQGTQEPPARTPLMFEIAARGYLAGGRTGSLAGDSAVDRLESYVWADQTLCAMGAGDQPPSSTPWTGWHFTGTAQVEGPGEMIVRVEWQRLWENGTRTSNGPSGSQSFRLRSGERVELDRVAPTSAGRCGTLEAKLEASVMARAAYLMSATGGVAGGVTGGVAAGVGGMRGGRGAGRGSLAGAAAAGSGVGAAAGSIPGAQTGVAAGGQGRSGAQTAAAAGVQGRGGRGAGRPGAAGTVTGAGSGVSGTGVAGGVTGGVATAAPSGSGARGGRGSTLRGRGGVPGSVSATGAGAAGVGGGVTGGMRGAGVGAAAGGRGRGTAEPGSIVLRGGQTTVATSNAYEAEIWLVHKKSDGAEVVQQQTVRFGSVGRDFAFPPVQVAGSGGPITIDISGSVQYLSGSALRFASGTVYGRRGAGASAAAAVTQPGAGEREPIFAVSIARRARRANPFIDTRGATDISLQIPKRDDVLSFELPPLQKSTEDLLKGNTFSLRLRVTPVR